MTTSDPGDIDRDFGAPDDRTWTLAELHDEITRQTVDSLAVATPSEAPPLLAALLDVARLRAGQEADPAAGTAAAS
ncbi:hypothetical protein [Microbacterium sp. Leaf179]|uniref:hypothetical protein n=1 Tax=Microbacterium sp. Leaf179 TaxID=1736288 RepID=UPI0006FE95A8|nr:hypothetical protein [Microbacterium sp. Leaf179]KQR86514.1 hypothetical protein ASF96_09115 [Microbacterium sp. Leaf179]